MITLITDFGTSDPYVGIMKGVILSVDPSAAIIDITHEIEPQDVSGAAYCIYSAYRYFSPGSIHVVVVDPGVGSHRSIIVLSMAGHYFLAPDNGVLSLILKCGKVDSITKVENDVYFLKPVSNTFHGRDIFAPVAGHLSKGLPVDRLGPEIKTDQTALLDLPMPYQSQNGEIVGTVIGVDHFGNLITNIDYQFIQKTFGFVIERDLKISIAGHQIAGLSACYRDAGLQSLLAVIGSMGFIEISVNCGSASEFCGESKGSIVTITAVDRQ
ncbi:MAG: SAM-dependent chlorinase/fluorinase [Desulfobacteraceae bacterium]|nr:SAM-dependent chlorinase/fluorinase [Desulfobacteraceae bacterium]MBC2754135.1 SAM-dependent chlorinase/fluorinase [Desulfobacteraceae bacterium]